MGLDCNLEWENFCSDSHNYVNDEINSENYLNENIPKCGNIYISTKTMIAYLSSGIDIHTLFWKIPIMKYSTPSVGVLKKQIKISFKSEQEVEFYKTNIMNEDMIDEYIISQVKNDTKFKDIRKISIGLCKKDIVTNRSKKKSAFYNCFVLIFRIKYEDLFREAHVKVFNTGKIEIPGVQSDEFLKIVLDTLVNTLNKFCNLNITYNKFNTETVLINSNFNCGFYLDREKLYDLLKYKYNIHSSFDPCSYPGIMSKFYYDLNNTTLQTGIKPINSKKYVTISFMIFRTGSVLIVGKCTEDILMKIYEFLKNIITTEYSNIYQSYSIVAKKKVTKKIRKKTIMISQ